MIKVIAITFVIIAALPVLASRAFCQGYPTMIEFPDIPANHWAYQDVAILADDGVVLSYPDDGFNGRRGMTNYEFASHIFRFLPLLGPGSPSFSNTDYLAAVRANFHRQIGGNLAAIDALQELVRSFAPEMAVLNREGYAPSLPDLTADIATSNSRLEGLKARAATAELDTFGIHRVGNRVPTLGDISCDCVVLNAWPSHAIITLQNLGIMVGYPKIPGVSEPTPGNPHIHKASDHVSY